MSGAEFARVAGVGSSGIGYEPIGKFVTRICAALRFRALLTDSVDTMIEMLKAGVLRGGFRTR